MNVLSPNISDYRVTQLINDSRNLNARLNAAKESVKIENETDALLKEQTDAFEAFLVKEVLDISLKRENELFGKDAGDEIYNSMYNDTMSKALSGGMGFSKLLYEFLKNNG